MKKFVSFFFKILIILIIIFLLFLIMEVFGFKQKLIADKNVNKEIDEGKYILTRLAYDYEGYLKKRRNLLETERVNLLQENIVNRTTSEKRKIRERLMQIETEKKIIDNRIKESEIELKEIEERTLNIEEEQKDFIRKITKMNEDYFMLLNEKEKAERYWKKYAGDLYDFFIKKNKGDLAKKTLIDEKFQTDNGKQFIMDEFRNLALLIRENQEKLAVNINLNKESSNQNENNINKEQDETGDVNLTSLEPKDQKEIIADEEIKKGFMKASLYEVLINNILSSDGPDGKNAYSLIQSKFGSNCIFTPDYPFNKENHSQVKHIIEEIDNQVGNCFKFILHRDLDKLHGNDNKYFSTDAQRTQIIINPNYLHSGVHLLAYKDDLIRYYWKFKIDKDFSVSNNWLSLFEVQASPNDGNLRLPVYLNLKKVLIDSAVTDTMQINYKPENEKIILSDQIELSKVIDKWLEAECIIKFNEKGYIRFVVRELNGNTLLSIESDNIRMWNDKYLVFRPAWGIFRNLDNISSLSPNEESVYYNDLTIQKIRFK